MKTKFRMGWPIVTCILGLYLCHVVYVQASMQCAHTLDGWNRGSVSLQCQEPKHYHCLPDEFGHFIQKCSNRILVPPGIFKKITVKLQSKYIPFRSKPKYVALFAFFTKIS